MGGADWEGYMARNADEDAGILANDASANGGIHGVRHRAVRSREGWNDSFTWGKEMSRTATRRATTRVAPTNASTGVRGQDALAPGWTYSFTTHTLTVALTSA